MIGARSPVAYLRKLLGGRAAPRRQALHLPRRIFARRAGGALLGGLAVGAGLGAGGKPMVARAIGSYTAEVLADGPVGYWRLNETSGTTAADSSGQANHGSYVNGVSLGAGGALLTESDPAAQLDGSNDYVSVPHHASLSPGAALTLEAWIKLSAYSGSYPRVISKSNSYELVLYTYAGAEGRLEFKLYTPGEGNLKTGYADRLLLATWYHVVATYDGATARIYIDGVERASGPRSGSIQNSGAALTLSRSDRPLAAVLDEVALYPTALSQFRIQTHYAASGRGSPPPPPPSVDGWVVDADGDLGAGGRVYVGRTTSLEPVYDDARMEIDARGRAESALWLLGDGTPGQGALLKYHVDSPHPVYYISSDNIFLFQADGDGAPHFNYYSGDENKSLTARFGIPTGAAQGYVGLRCYEPLVLAGGSTAMRGAVTLGLLNGSGQTLQVGDVVQISASAPNTVTLTQVAKAKRPGVVTKGNINTADVWVTFGPARALVACDNGSVNPGDLLCSSSSNGKAFADNSETNRLYILGQALTGKGSGAGFVDALIS